MKSRGVTGETDLNAIKELSITKADILLEFLLNECEFDRILICIDNIDDCSIDVREIAFAFAQSLSDTAIECDGKSNNILSVLVPLRRYTNVSTDTEGYPKIDIPVLSASDTMRIKIKHVKDLINKNYEKNIKEYILSSFVREKKIITSKGEKIVYERQYAGRFVQVDNVSTLFDLFLIKLQQRDRKGLLDFIEKISFNNLKLVTKNTYNIFHSCKLNLSELMTFVFTSEGTREYRELLETLENSSYGPPVVYDFAMAIHYPFYDVETSFIVNIFNLNNSTAPNDWRNTFCLVRLLVYLSNNGCIFYGNLNDIMKSIGYDQSHFEMAIQKALNFCLLNTSVGTKIEHMNQKTLIELSSSGKYIIENSIADHRYLCYICEDTFMDKQYIVPIEKKYTKGQCAGNLVAIYQAVSQFLSFLKEEEYLELEYMTTQKGWDKILFLRDFSIRLDRVPALITDVIIHRINEEKNIYN